jgi:transposase
MLLVYRYRIKSLTGLLNSQARDKLAAAQRARKRRQTWPRLAKSVLDAGWSSFRGMLRYKATARGAWYEEVNESFSTRVCSSCHAKTGPKGIAELGIRSWVCAECGVAHDRDINSARNILFRSGLSNAC